MTILFNDQYLNRTENKAPRRAELITAAGCGYLGVLCHETAGNRADPRNTLNYNLHRIDPKTGKLIESSYDYLIDQWGVIWRYVDSRVFTSYHSGVSAWACNGTTYRNYAVNEVLISVEIDGPNDGTPALPAQIAAFGQLALYLHETFLIPLQRIRYPTHKEVAPGRKTDPRGYTPEQVLAAAAQGVVVPAPTVDYAKTWGTAFPYFEQSGIAQEWRRAALVLGAATSDEHATVDGLLWRHFKGGAISYDPNTGTLRSYFPRAGA